MNEIWISPSDLSYFFSDSKIGFYDKYILKINRPKAPFPSVFNTIDGCMKTGFDKKFASDIATGAPEAIVTHDDSYIQSKLFTLGKYKVGFKGKLDSLLVHDDKTYSIVDYKTTNISDKLLEIYSLQLIAYAYCLENPLYGDPKTIQSLGLIVFEPKSFDFKSQKAQLHGGLRWIDIPFDKTKFKTWIIKELSPLLNGTREDIFMSSSDKSWQEYIECFHLENTDE
jgi:hypothetical protein